MQNANKMTKNMQDINNITKISNTISTITDKINSSNIYEVWEAYKSMHGLKRMDAQSEREILTLLQVNNLNPFKKEAYIIPFNGRYTVVVAYQTLLIRAYEAGYSKYNLEFKEEMVKTIKIDSKGNKIVQDDWQCTAYFKSDNGNSYSFSVLFNEYYKNTPIWREKPTFMLRKCAVSCLCRTLPGAGLESMPYIREELGDTDSFYETQKVQQIEYTQNEKIVTKEMHSVDYESVTKSDNNKNMPFNLSTESEIDNKVSDSIQDEVREQYNNVGNNIGVKLAKVIKEDVRYINVTNDMISNNIADDNVKEDSKPTNPNTVDVNKVNVNSTKFNCYKSLLIAARSMYNYVKIKPFDSIKQINLYLSDISIGNDVKLLEHFNKHKELKSVKYWIELIRSYIMSSNSLASKLDQFDAFVAFEEDKYKDSPLKLFGYLFGEEELRCLFENYRVAS